MRLFDYMQSSEADRLTWMESFKITTGLKYFGGKSQIGKYLMNRICNMAVQMHIDGVQEVEQAKKNGTYTKDMKMTRPDIFIDAFTGGGKIGLSIPEGWFDTIVINDLNYGVYSYFKCCKEQPEELLKAIEFLGQHMNKDIYHFISFNRANNGVTSNLEEAEELAALAEDDIERYVIADFVRDLTGKDISLMDKDEFENLLIQFNQIIENKIKTINRKRDIAQVNFEMITDERVEPLIAAAMTYWVTQLEFLGMTDPYKVTYVANSQDNKSLNVTGSGEKERIEKAIIHACKQIPKISKKLNANNVIIENLDYRELIKKYNGKPYVDTYGKEHEPEECLGSQSKLWYFDPPYHPATLYAGMEAPYEDKFSWGMAREMVEILANKENKYAETYGELRYFIKSDYDPKTTYERFKETLEITKEKLDKLRIGHPDVWKKSGAGTKYASIFGDGQAKAWKDEYIDEEDGHIKKRISKLLNYAARMSQQIEYSRLAYNDFDLLEENEEIYNMTTGITTPKKENPVYYKELLGSFEKGMKDEESEGVLKGEEFIWCRGNYIR